jgi:hypothetical protein
MARPKAECGPERHDSLPFEACSCAEKDQKWRFPASHSELKQLGKVIRCAAANADAKIFFFA